MSLRSLRTSWVVASIGCVIAACAQSNPSAQIVGGDLLPVNGELTFPDTTSVRNDEAAIRELEAKCIVDLRVDAQGKPIDPCASCSVSPQPNSPIEAWANSSLFESALVKDAGSWVYKVEHAREASSPRNSSVTVSYTTGLGGDWRFAEPLEPSTKKCDAATRLRELNETYGSVGARFSCGDYCVGKDGAICPTRTDMNAVGDYASCMCGAFFNLPGPDAPLTLEDRYRLVGDLFCIPNKTSH